MGLTAGVVCVSGGAGLRGFRTPVLVVAAALFGAAVSAPSFGFWDQETGRRRAVEARLAASADHAKALGSRKDRLQGGSWTAARGRGPARTGRGQASCSSEVLRRGRTVR